METKSIISKILSLPEDFHNAGDKSEYSLLQASGYFEAYTNITENALKEALEQQPHYIDQWLQWSADKRTSGGWYFLEDDKHKYIVGCLENDKGYSESYEYSDGVSACASFIKKEIEDTRFCFINLKRVRNRKNV